MSRYAVVDVETTGFSAAHNHRIVEIAVVLVSDDGRMEYEWETLVNPQREVSASEIHGLTGSDLYSAPTFAQVASQLSGLLAGRVPVAHNLAFDAPFIAAEFERAGYAVPLTTTCGICTMRLAPRYLPNGPRTLEACCECIGCRVESAHAALEDARATALLLAHYISADQDFLSTWSDQIATAQTSAWPSVPECTVACVTRGTARTGSREHFLGRLAARAPRNEMHPEANSYMALLDRALLDRQISLHEADELVSAANMMGITRDDALGIHEAYLKGLARLALDDGILTQDERADLETVSEALGLSQDAVDAALSSADSDAAAMVPPRFTLSEGNTVVFTGEAPGFERADLEYQAQTLGLRVTGSVSGKTTLLVAADPDSLSGKARKARELGVPIVDYPTYLQMLGAMPVATH